LVISDLNFNRIRRENYLKTRKLRGLPELPLGGAGKPVTFNVLFCRDPVAELGGGAYYQTPPPQLRVDQILKLMAIYELHGLNDVAVELTMTFKEELGRRLDVDRAIGLLCDNDGGVVREYSAEVRKLKSSLAAARRRVHALRREVSAALRAKGRLVTHVVEELEDVKAALSPVIVAGHELPQPQQYTYEGHAAIDAVIPEDAKDVTRARGAAIMRIAPQQSVGRAELHVRIMFNCYCSETNAVRFAIFAEGSEHPVAVLTEDLIAAELTLVDQDAFVPVADASQRLVLEIRAGLAQSGGILSLNHVPAPALASAVRFRWFPIEATSKRLPAEPEGIIAQHEYLIAKRDERRAEPERFLAERDKMIAGYKHLLAERDGVIAENERLLAERDGTIAEQKRLLGERDAALVPIQGSRSWRLTAPLRGAMKWLRR
jgi:hypothetical protein